MCCPETCQARETVFETEKILVSACPMGHKVRYNGSDASQGNPLLENWRAEGRLVTYCPEVASGFATPRAPAEILGRNGAGILDDNSRVLQDDGEDVSGQFLRGARSALEAARRANVRMAVLKDVSPSCGSTRIYDGSFSGEAKKGFGVTTALLERHGIRVFSEKQTAEAAEYLKELQQGR